MKRYTPPRPVVALLLSSAVALAACTDTAADDHETCVLRGFDRGTKEYQYCRDKLQQFRREEFERNQRFLDLLTG